MSLTSSVVDVALASPSVDVHAQSTQVSTGGLRDWIGDNIVFTILILAACVIGVGGMRGNLSRVVTVGGLSLVGIAFFAIAQNQDAANGIGNWIIGLFGIKTT
ncbi:hypothetical protein [Prescottella equi]|uniref:hypothetical protein n=1 Tax=Rhodococcus hoagii TaxID=43767 RepID=UPI003851139A